MPVEYARSPVVVAVFEFFIEGANYDPTVAKNVFDALRLDYAGKTDEQLSAVELELGPAGPRVQQTQPRHRLWSADGKTLAQFAKDMFAFNALSPYRHYREYEAGIGAVFETYVSRAMPRAFRFIGQRYINHITLPAKDSHPADYFSVYPRLATRGRIFAAQIQTDELPNGAVVLNLAFQGSDSDDRPTFALDLYARTSRGADIPVEWPAAKSWHDEAHEAILRAFQLALTPKGHEFLGRTSS